jgi:hypothetical protein
MYLITAVAVGRDTFKADSTEFAELLLQIQSTFRHPLHRRNNYFFFI